MYYYGIAASHGIGIGRAHVSGEDSPVVDSTTLSPDEAATEWDAFTAAQDLTRRQIAGLRDRERALPGQEDGGILDAHLLLLDDPEWIAAIRAEVMEHRLSAAAAVLAVTERYANMLSALDDEYLRERASDVRDVGNRLLRNVLGLKPAGERLDHDSILVSSELTPSAVLNLDRQYVKGLAAATGGQTSHGAILARNLGIPAVLGLGSATIHDGDMLILDGTEGTLIVNPDETTLAEYVRRQKAALAARLELKSLRDLPAVTLDGHVVRLSGNIGDAGDIEGVLESGGSGVGLYRTEFLFMGGSALPSEERQFASYKAAAEKLAGKPLIIRALDIGGDKQVPGFAIPPEANPFLGWRAIRISLACPDIFKTQLRAILRAGAYGDVRIMYPMISGVHEVRAANALLAEAKGELRREGVPYDEDMKAGVMIETPAAALTADIISREADFFSIGTNDLTQYCLAVDRMNEKVNSLYQPLHPAVLRLIQGVIGAARRSGRHVGMCGELAGDPLAVLILLGLGLEEFSMSAASLPDIKRIIRATNYEVAQQVAAAALTMESAEDVAHYAGQMLAELAIKIR